jgi:hypothetical protein
MLLLCFSLLNQTDATAVSECATKTRANNRLPKVRLVVVTDVAGQARRSLVSAGFGASLLFTPATSDVTMDKDVVVQRTKVFRIARPTTKV